MTTKRITMLGTMGLALGCLAPFLAGVAGTAQAETLEEALALGLSRSEHVLVSPEKSETARPGR